jgi:hypothetical protein
VEAVEFPILPEPEHQLAIANDVKEEGFEVVILDPLYRGMGDLDSNRMPEIASTIVAFTKAVSPASLIISHHVTKASAREMDGPPSLEDLSGAGLAESCGNWWLLGRNEPYRFNGIHDLVVQYGGRDEQAGIKRIVFNEKEWTFEVTGGEDLKEQRRAESERRRQEAKQAKLRQAKAAIKHCLANQKEARPKAWIETRSGESQAVTRSALGELLTDLVVEEADYTDSKGRKKSGYRLRQNTPQNTP